MKNTSNTVKIISLILSMLMLLSLASCSMSNLNASDGNGGGYNGGMAESAPGASLDGENYTEITENEFVNTGDSNTSYFSIDANTASYPNLRSLINKGYSIHKDAVRVEEILNYFDYDYKASEGEDILALNASMFDTPYNPDTKLLTIGLAAEEIDFSGVKNNLVFLIDTSGSMFSDEKLPLVQQAFMMLTEALNPEDRVSIVTYAGSDKVALDGAYGYEKAKIMAVIEDLSAGGSTAGADGINSAYRLAEKYFIQGGNNRVILATDGDFNVGVSSTRGLENLISEKRQSGVYFSVYGVGRGNIQSEKMETLALKGNGTYSYIDSVKEARRALVQGIGGSIVTVAKDVKAGITFNPEFVESFRLIGYENKLLTEEEFNDSNTDAGELGSGHTVTVVYEIKLKSEGVLTDDSVEKLADVIIKYKPTENAGGDAEEEKELTLGVMNYVYRSTPTAENIFVASVIEFALILRDSEYKADANLEELITRLSGLDLANDEFKAEFRELVSKYQANINRHQ
nr:DUF3520 domain-containing protein [Oscillospiraceae bacterium]